MQAMGSNPTSLSMKFSDLTFEKFFAIKVHVNWLFLSEVSQQKVESKCKDREDESDHAALLSTNVLFQRPEIYLVWRLN